MGYRLKENYDKANNPQTPRGAFCEGLFAGTLGFMVAIGGWLISLFCYFGLSTPTSATLAGAISVGVGLVLGINFARGCREEHQEKKETR